ncbi:rhodanese-like domain-containing protein [bacterium]|nr:rhodanese-like domain-containing protein [bacterium]
MLDELSAKAFSRIEPNAGYAGDLTVQEAWELLEKHPAAMLVDVRTQPEWIFAGFPDLASLSKDVAMLPWRMFPAMQQNADFVTELTSLVADRQTPLLFLCRTGGRSREAAIAMASQGYAHCFNLQDGFDGPLNPEGRRGTTSGWRAANLPWRQQ